MNKTQLGIIASSLLCLFLLTACGQKGDLTLPSEQPAAQQSPETPTREQP